MKDLTKRVAGTDAGTADTNKRPERNGMIKTQTMTMKTDALTYLQSIYNDPLQPDGMRMRAAGLALPHETPRLAVQAQISEQDFATLLDRRLARLEEMRRLESNGGEQINAKAIEADATQPEVKPTPAPLARIYDNRRWPHRF